MEISPRDPSQPAQSQNNVSRLLSKYGNQPQSNLTTAGPSAAVRLAMMGGGGARPAVSKQNSTTSMNSQASGGSQTTKVGGEGGGFDIGRYDGGFEAENEGRGSFVHGEAALELALDSSFGGSL